jgi:tetratricopeptide (TPR) repeat protein
MTMAWWNRQLASVSHSSSTDIERGETYRLMGRYDEAIAGYTRAIDLDTTRAWVVAERGETYQLMERCDEAIADFNRAIDLDLPTGLPKDSDSHRVNEADGLTDRCRACLTRHCSSPLLNFPAHCPEDANATEKYRSLCGPAGDAEGPLGRPYRRFLIAGDGHGRCSWRRSVWPLRGSQTERLTCLAGCYRAAPAMNAATM